MQAFQTGDWVVFRKTKFSQRPGPRAENISPAQHGDLYTYTVDKFWIVVSISDDQRLTLQTRSGKQHVIDASDLRLYKANWWQRWRYRDRFREIEQTLVPDPESPNGNSPREASQAG